MSQLSRTIIITGANRGLGFTLAKSITQDKTPTKLILTSRDLSKLQNSIKEMQSDPKYQRD